jgi:hypothetical protein
VTIRIPFAAAARRRFQQHRIADVVGLFLQKRLVLFLSMVTGDQRHRRLLHQRLRRALAAHRAQRLDRRSDEHDPVRRARRGELLVLGQEPVARMDRLGAGLLGRGDDAIDVEIAFARGRRTDQHRFVGQPGVPRVGVGLGKHGDGAHAKATRGLDDAACDFAAIGDQYLAEHRSILERDLLRIPND